MSPVRRLTREQYNNTVRDLIGDKRTVGNRFPTDDQSDDVFVPTNTLIVTGNWAEQAMLAAEELTEAAVPTLSTLLPCKPTDVGEEACSRQFIETFGKRAYRRPLDAGEVVRLQKMYALGAGNGGFTHGIEVVIRTMLQSPFFLYRLELGKKDAAALGAGTVRLTPHEVAARLSYLLWESMPDRTLTAAADTGKLASADGIAAEAKRLIADSRARNTLVRFHQRWFGLDQLDEVSKDPKKYRDFNGAVLQAMKNESRQFLDNILKADARFDTLMTSPVTYVNTHVAKLYGVPPPAGENFERVDLNVTQRAGVLTNVAVLTVHTHADESAAIHRGKFVRERFLCQTPPDPPADLMVVPPVPKAGIPTRERLAEHSASPACRPCHQLMDAIGFGFEHYDGIGRYRTVEQGKPVNAAGQLAETDINGTFLGVPDLAKRLVASAQVRDCVVSQVLRFAQGPEASADTCARDKMRFAFANANGDMRELVVSVARTEGFQVRKALGGEVQP